MKDENLIDLVGVGKKLYVGRKTIINLSSIFFVIGLIVSLIIPPEYKSEITFIPQTSDQSTTTNRGIGSLASLAGINLNNDPSLDNYISPLLYYKIIDSDEFSAFLINQILIFEDSSSVSVRDYISSPSKINNFLGTKAENDDTYKLIQNFNYISDKDFRIIKLFREKFSIEANKNEGYIKVEARDRNPIVSTQIVELVTKHLQSIIISLRTNKIKEQLNYSQKQYIDKKNEFEFLQQKLAKFRDRNKSISTAIFLSELQKLESEFQLQQSILLNLATEYNNNKIKLNNNTPIFSVIDQVSIPNEKSSPAKIYIILIFSVIGLLISIIYLLFIDSIKELIFEIIS